jgi:4-carboxymuconolactone decarboxylase
MFSEERQVDTNITGQIFSMQPSIPLVDAKFWRCSLSEDRFQHGMDMRKSVLGTEHVARAEANKTEFDADFQRFITETAWGSIWTRTGLDKKTRHLLTIALLASLGKNEELAMHIRATRNTGVTPEEVKEVLLHVSVYAGVPAANSAFAIAKRVYDELGK